ncbi:hypothetical protein ON010_g8046 [Phytophthora cinnamomi]|nr:hypothetical protein ON010_g8046 [Phytophthora cinnamomi]
MLPPHGLRSASGTSDGCSVRPPARAVTMRIAPPQAILADAGPPVSRIANPGRTSPTESPTFRRCGDEVESYVSSDRHAKRRTDAQLDAQSVAEQKRQKQSPTPKPTTQQASTTAATFLTLPPHGLRSASGTSDGCSVRPPARAVTMRIAPPQAILADAGPPVSRIADPGRTSPTESPTFRRCGDEVASCVSSDRHAKRRADAQLDAQSVAEQKRQKQSPTPKPTTQQASTTAATFLTLPPHGLRSASGTSDGCSVRPPARAVTMRIAPPQAILADAGPPVSRIADPGPTSPTESPTFRRCGDEVASCVSSDRHAKRRTDAQLDAQSVAEQKRQKQSPTPKPTTQQASTTAATFLTLPPHGLRSASGTSDGCSVRPPARAVTMRIAPPQAILADAGPPVSRIADPGRTSPTESPTFRRCGDEVASCVSSDRRAKRRADAQLDAQSVAEQKRQKQSPTAILADAGPPVSRIADPGRTSPTESPTFRRCGDEVASCVSSDRHAKRRTDAQLDAQSVAEQKRQKQSPTPKPTTQQASTTAATFLTLPPHGLRSASGTSDGCSVRPPARAVTMRIAPPQAILADAGPPVSRIADPGRTSPTESPTFRRCGDEVASCPKPTTQQASTTAATFLTLPPHGLRSASGTSDGCSVRPPARAVTMRIAPPQAILADAGPPVSRIADPGRTSPTESPTFRRCGDEVASCVSSDRHAKRRTDAQLDAQSVAEQKRQKQSPTPKPTTQQASTTAATFLTLPPHGLRSASGTSDGCSVRPPARAVTMRIAPPQAILADAGPPVSRIADPGPTSPTESPTFRRCGDEVASCVSSDRRAKRRADAQLDAQSVAEQKRQKQSPTPKPTTQQASTTAATFLTLPPHGLRSASGTSGGCSARPPARAVTMRIAPPQAILADAGPPVSRIADPV